jgi:hypothetical protein
MIKVTLNGIEVDLGNSVVALSKQAYNLSNLNDRNISFSNEITLPRTQKNISIFEHACFINSTSNQFERFYEAHVIDNTFLFDGVGVLREANNEYKLQIIDKAKEFFTILDKNINTLDFESDDILFNLTTYNNIKTTGLAGTSVWLWSCIATHETRQAKKTIIAPVSGDRLKWSRPSFRATIMRDRVNALTEWSIVGGPARIENAVIPANTKAFYFTSYQKAISQTYVVSGTFNVNDLGPADFIISPLSITFADQIDIGSFPAASNTLPTIFRLRGAVSLTADFTLTFKATSSGGTDVQNISYNILSTDTYIDLTTPIFKSTDSTYSIKIELAGTGNFTFSNTLLYTLTEENDFGSFTLKRFEGYKVKVHDNLPDYKIIDLARLSWWAGGTFFTVDSFEKTINQFSISTLSKLDALDWSDRFIQGTEFISNDLGGYSQINELRYDNDDTVSANLGYDFFTIDNETLDDITTQIQLPFGASNEVEIDGYNMADLAIYDDDGRIEEDVNERILFQYEDSFSGSNISFAIFSPFSWTNLKLQGYKDLFTSLNRIRVVDCKMNLKKLDFQSIDFRKPIYIDYFGSYFYVLKISNFIPGKATSVKLLKYL